MAQQTNAIARQEETLAALVKRYEANIVAALPTHVKPERVLSVIRTAITSNPGLRECSPMSVLAGIVAASRLGLELDPVLGQAYLIPRWNKNTKRMEATFQIGYRGKLDLFQRATPGIVVQVRHVRENDDFELAYEPRPKLTHRINHRKPRGPVVASYTYVEFPDGRIEVFEPMGIDEALAIRDRFAPHARCPKCWSRRGERDNCEVCRGTGESEEFTGPWLTDQDEMVRKTTLHRDSKWIAQSPEMRDATRMENRIDSGEPPETVVLELPAEETENAETAGATDARKESLKQKLAAQTGHAKQDNPTTSEGEGKGSQPQEQTDGAQPSGTTPVKSPPSPAPGPRKAVRDVDELPDPLEVDDEELYYNGILYNRSPDNTGWLRAEKQAEPAKATPRRGRDSRVADTFDFGAREGK